MAIGPPREGETYASIMNRATNLSALGVVVKGARVSKAGAIILEVKGSAEHADKLAEELKAKLGEDTQVWRPEKRSAVMVINIPEWISEKQIGEVLEKSLGKQDEVRNLSIRTNTNGRGSRYAWFDVPARAARLLQDQRSIGVGWTRCRIKVLQDRRDRCYRCLESGHLANNCKGPDRKGNCNRCFMPGHRAADCKTQLKANSKEAVQDTRTSKHSIGENPDVTVRGARRDSEEADLTQT